MSAAPPPVPGQQDADHFTGWIQPASEQGALPRLLSALVSRAWVVVLTTALAVGAALGYLATAEKRYEAETDVLVTPVPNDTAVPGFGLILDSSDPASAFAVHDADGKLVGVVDRAAVMLVLIGAMEAS